VIEKGCRREYLTLMERKETTEKCLGDLEWSGNALLFWSDQEMPWCFGVIRKCLGDLE
jgi:hypothetical protein